MEHNQEFKNLLVHIQQLEQQLEHIGESIKINEKCGTDAEADIEEHFARCVNALAARKLVLLKDLGEKVNTQSMRNIPWPLNYILF
jgi:hypothetical protein